MDLMVNYSKYSTLLFSNMKNNEQIPIESEVSILCNNEKKNEVFISLTE